MELMAELGQAGFSQVTLVTDIKLGSQQGATSGQTIPGQTIPGQTTSGQTIPGQTTVPK